MWAANEAGVVKAAALYLRCLGWGLAIGAVVGGGFGLVIGLLLAAGGHDVDVVWIALVAGLAYGMAVAAAPSVLGGIAVVILAERRHPAPASYEPVRHDLTVWSAVVVGLLDLVVLAWWGVVGAWTAFPVVLAVLAVVDVAAAVMLKPACASIARAWAEDDDCHSGRGR